MFSNQTPFKVPKALIPFYFLEKIYIFLKSLFYSISHSYKITEIKLSYYEYFREQGFSL